MPADIVCPIGEICPYEVAEWITEAKATMRSCRQALSDCNQFNLERMDIGGDK